MEKEENGSAIATVADSPRPPIPAKKRSGSTNIFRAVMLAVGGRSPRKSHVSNIIVGTNTADTVIKTLVGGMRPLHYSLDYQHPAPPPPPPDMVLDAYYDVHMPPSPCSSVGMSRFASAEDLQLLDGTSEDTSEEDGIDGEPNAIDMKAEEFITMFYKQMRQQQQESLNSAAEEKSISEESASPLNEEDEAMVVESEEKSTAEASASPLNEEDEAKVVESEEPVKTTETENATAEESANPLEPIEEEKATIEDCAGEA